MVGVRFADGPVVGQIRLLWEKVQEIVKSSAAFHSA